MQVRCQEQLGLSYTCMCLKMAHRLDQTKNGRQEIKQGFAWVLLYLGGRERLSDKQWKEVTTEMRKSWTFPQRECRWVADGTAGPGASMAQWVLSTGSLCIAVQPWGQCSLRTPGLEGQSPHFHPLPFLTVWNLAKDTRTTNRNEVFLSCCF